MKGLACITEEVVDSSTGARQVQGFLRCWVRWIIKVGTEGLFGSRRRAYTGSTLTLGW
jgi:hypothetical protein